MLQKAAANCHTDVCKFLVSHSAKVNAHDAEAQTPLMWACGNGHTDTVEFLIKAEAKVDLESRSGKNALHFVAMFGHMDIVEFLVERESKISIAKQDEHGRTALMCSVAAGHVEMAMELLKNKCPIDKVNKREMTALSVAAENQQYECCKLMINNGADLYVQDENGQLASDLAEGTLNARVVELFRQAMLENPQKEDE